jgi:hypothetical protein
MTAPHTLPPRLTTAQRHLLAEMTSCDATHIEGRYGNDAICVRHPRNCYPYRSLVALLKHGYITGAGCNADRFTITEQGRAVFGEQTS